LPQDKAKIVEELQKRGKTVCFIGDGINDTVVLQRADVSISLNGASTIAMDIADILLIKPDLSNLLYLLKMSKDLDRQMNNSMKLNTVSSVS
jgi:Cu2+-exporting ATPase